jgi:hypothetical protein
MGYRYRVPIIRGMVTNLLITINHLYIKILKIMPSLSRPLWQWLAFVFRWRPEALVEAEYDFTFESEHLQH